MAKISLYTKKQFKLMDFLPHSLCRFLSLIYYIVLINYSEFLMRTSITNFLWQASLGKKYEDKDNENLD
jgi:hypothetical protein